MAHAGGHRGGRGGPHPGHDCARGRVHGGSGGAAGGGGGDPGGGVPGLLEPGADYRGRALCAGAGGRKERGAADDRGGHPRSGAKCSHGPHQAYPARRRRIGLPQQHPDHRHAGSAGGELGRRARGFGLALPDAALVRGHSGWHDHPDRDPRPTSWFRGLLQAEGHEPFTMFELTGIALPIAVAGLALNVLLAPNLLPDRLPPRQEARSGGAGLLGADDRGTGRPAGRPRRGRGPGGAPRVGEDRLLRARRRGRGPDLTREGAEGR